MTKTMTVKPKTDWRTTTHWCYSGKHKKCGRIVHQITKATNNDFIGSLRDGNFIESFCKCNCHM